VIKGFEMGGILKQGRRFETGFLEAYWDEEPGDIEWSLWQAGLVDTRELKGVES
jgi:hypothetical protein